MCSTLLNIKFLIVGCTFLAIGFTSALIGFMTSAWAVLERSDGHGFSNFVSYGLWQFQRCGGFRINKECTKGKLVQTDFEYLGAQGGILFHAVV